MSIILIRHGETALNAARVLQPADTPLSERGRRQAEAVAIRLAAMKIDGIVSSDLARAVETSRAIATATGLAPRTSALLQERNFGDLRGRAYDGLRFDPIAMEDAPPNGESMTVFDARVKQVVALLCEWHGASGGILAVVTHGLLIRTLVERHLLLPMGMPPPQRIANTSLTIFSPEPPHRVSAINNSEHLGSDLVDDVRAVSGV
jgi:broad specificity phosphatase PhoE